MRYVLLFLIVFALSSVALGQFDMSGLGHMQSQPSMALQRGDIRKELKLTRAQNSQIDMIEKEVSSAASGSGQSFTAPFQKMKEADEQIMALLDDPQKKRLFEIQIQMQGPPAMAYPEVAGPLGLTEAQMKQITDLQSTFSTQAMDLTTHNPGRGTMGKITKLRDERDANMLQILTSAQRDKFKEMQGKPFKDARPKGSVF